MTAKIDKSRLQKWAEDNNLEYDLMDADADNELAEYGNPENLEVFREIEYEDQNGESLTVTFTYGENTSARMLIESTFDEIPKGEYLIEDGDLNLACVKDYGDETVLVLPEFVSISEVDRSVENRPWRSNCASERDAVGIWIENGELMTKKMRPAELPEMHS